MSAWDVTGAAIALCIAAICYRDIWLLTSKRVFMTDVETGGTIVTAIAATGWLAFCLARMFGAHL